jgi:hypothetical protein
MAINPLTTHNPGVEKLGVVAFVRVENALQAETPLARSITE